jgi:ATP-binding cassette subfamily B (MDR/TAP) protein 1
LGLLGIAFCTGTGVALKDFYFKSLGSNTTYYIRCELYAKIIQKNIGWFDDRDHSSGVLTSAIAKDTSILNGISTESLGPLFEGGMAAGGGVVVALFFCW